MGENGTPRARFRLGKKAVAGVVAVFGVALFAFLSWFVYWDSDTARDATKVQGTWQLVLCVSNGTVIDVDADESAEFVGNTHILYRNDRELESHTFRLIRMQNGFRIEEFVRIRGREALVLRGLLKVDDDILTICYADPTGPTDGLPFPKNFSRKETDQGILHIYRRVKL